MSSVRFTCTLERVGAREAIIPNWPILSKIFILPLLLVAVIIFMIAIDLKQKKSNETVGFVSINKHKKINFIKMRHSIMFYQ